MPMPIYSLYRAFYLLSRKDQINSKQVISHFKVIRRLFRASFNEWQPSEAKGWSKNAFFTYWRPSICEISKLEVFQKKRNVSPVTLYNDVTSCQKSEETNDAFSSKCWITLLLGPFWRQKTHLAHFVKNGSFREKSENVVIQVLLSPNLMQRIRKN